MSCTRQNYPKCDGTGIGMNKNIFYMSDTVQLPDAELRNKQWSEEEIIHVIRNEAVPKMLWRFQQYPQPGYGIVDKKKISGIPLLL